MLGVRPALGQLLESDDEARPNSTPVVVLAYNFWQSEFGGAANVVGRKVLVNGHPLTVIGVATATFRGVDVGQVPVVWIPASMSAAAIPRFNALLDRRTRWMQVMGRLKEGTTLRQAQAGLQPWLKSMLQEDTLRAGFPVITAVETPELSRFLAGAERPLAESLWVERLCAGVAGRTTPTGGSARRQFRWYSPNEIDCHLANCLDSDPGGGSGFVCADPRCADDQGTRLCDLQSFVFRSGPSGQRLFASRGRPANAPH